MLIKVKAFTCSKKEEVKKIKDDEFEVMVCEAPVRGEANKRIIEVLKDYFKVPSGGVKMVKGATSPRKIFDINK